MFKVLKNYRREVSHPEDGQGLVEYALILVLVAVVVIAILSLLGPAVGNIFSEIVAVLNGETTASESTLAAECLCDGDSIVDCYSFAAGQTHMSPSPRYSNTCDAGNYVTDEPITVVRGYLPQTEIDTICAGKTQTVTGQIVWCN